MKFSLSGRCVLPAEAGAGLALENEAFLALAHDVGFDGVDLRWEQMNPTLPDAKVEEVRRLCRETGLEVTTLNAKSLAAEPFGRLLVLARELGCGQIRVRGDVATLRQAADLAGPAGIRLAEQMHTGREFETVAGARQMLSSVDRENFGIIVEPANLRMAGEPFTAENFEPLRDRIFWCHVQSLAVVAADAAEGKALLRGGGEVGFRRVPIHENDDCDFRGFFTALKAIGFDGTVTCLEPAPTFGDQGRFFMDYLAFLRDVARG
ncbi:MAG: hypothetical protein EBZ59_07260 [Planctomycetia bacterium]|nr:hypothetical protein [Planctomycetia bacterium]